jgi:hypothetical protein
MAKFRSALLFLALTASMALAGCATVFGPHVAAGPPGSAIPATPPTPLQQRAQRALMAEAAWQSLELVLRTAAADGRLNGDAGAKALTLNRVAYQALVGFRQANGASDEKAQAQALVSAGKAVLAELGGPNASTQLAGDIAALNLALDALSAAFAGGGA